jgi:hypothetical protein
MLCCSAPTDANALFDEPLYTVLVDVAADVVTSAGRGAGSGEKIGGTNTAGVAGTDMTGETGTAAGSGMPGTTGGGNWWTGVAVINWWSASLGSGSSCGARLIAAENILRRLKKNTERTGRGLTVVLRIRNST